MEKHRLDGKVAIVTGGAAGMGLATAELFARAGGKVVLSDIDVAGGSRVVDGILAAGGEAIFVAADVSDDRQVEMLVARSVERFGRLDCAVNNAAGKPDDKPIADVDVEQFDRLIALNLRSVLVCMKHQIRQMLAQGHGGSIVNIGSVSSERARRNNPAYVASKHAVLGLTRSGSLEYAAQNIRVNAVLPGTIDTPMIRATLENLGRNEADVAGSFSSMGRFGKPDEVAQASLWLCSDASSYVTGQALAVDGGYLTLTP